MVSHGQTIEWHLRDGSWQRLTVDGHSTQREAIAAALESARVFGWTPPRWWQWWRWGDCDYSKLERQSL